MPVYETASRYRRTRTWHRYRGIYRVDIRGPGPLSGHLYSKRGTYPAPRSRIFFIARRHTHTHTAHPGPAFRFARAPSSPPLPRRREVVHRAEATAIGRKSNEDGALRAGRGRAAAAQREIAIGHHCGRYKWESSALFVTLPVHINQMLRG